MTIIAHKKFFIGFSLVLVLLSLVAIGVWGLELGVDFTGGSILTIEYEGEVPAPADVSAALSGFVRDSASIRQAGENGYTIRTRFLTDAERGELVSLLSINDSTPTVERFSSVGPSIGAELRSKALIAVVLVVVAIILFVAFAFRGLSAPRGTRGAGSPSTSLRTGEGAPPSSWKYGLAAIAALVHDITIPVGVYAAFGAVHGFQIDSLFITALLAILGLSVNDTIIVFDRVRENLIKNRESGVREPFSQTVGKSLSQTYVRSINTSLTTIVVLVALLIVGGEAVRNFALPLALGIAVGTYSSIFLASPLLVVFAGEKQV